MKIRFTRIPNHILEMLFVKNFTSRQYAIITLIARITYGCQVPWAFYEKGDFKLAGLHRGSIGKELVCLADMKVVEIDQEQKVIRINPKINEWIMDQNRNMKPENVPKTLRRVLSKQLKGVHVLRTLKDDAFDEIDDKIYNTSLVKKINKEILLKNMRFMKNVETSNT